MVKYPHQRIIYCGREAIHMCNINKRNKLKEKWKRCQRQMICPRSKLVSTKARNITMSTEKKKKKASTSFNWVFVMPYQVACWGHFFVCLFFRLALTF